MREKSLKVLQVFGSLGLGGAESRMMDIYRNIDRSKCGFDFLTIKGENQHYRDEIISLGGRVYEIGSPRKVGLFKHMRSMCRIMKDGGYDAVHAHTSYHCAVVMLCGWLSGIPVRISHARTTGSKNKGLKVRASLFLGKKIINIFATHRFAISQAAGFFLYGKKPFTFVKNAFDIEKIQVADKEQVKQLKQKLLLPEDAMVIGQIGRFNIMKNHKFTLRWFSEFIKKNTNAVLLLVGDGPLRKETEELASRLNIEQKVFFTGHLSNVCEVLNAFDVLIFPSVYEGLGNVALEAQAAGIPVVESDTVPVESDLGLGLVERCSLSDSFEVWDRAVERSLKKQIPDKETIYKKISESGYSIDSVAEFFISSYGGAK